MACTPPDHKSKAVLEESQITTKKSPRANQLFLYILFCKYWIRFEYILRHRKRNLNDGKLEQSVKLRNLCRQMQRSRCTEVSEVEPRPKSRGFRRCRLRDRCAFYGHRRVRGTKSHRHRHFICLRLLCFGFKLSEPIEGNHITQSYSIIHS